MKMNIARRSLSLVVAFAVTITAMPTTLLAQANNSPVLAKQMAEDMAEGKNGFRKDPFSQTLDDQTFNDLELNEVAAALMKLAPSQMAKDRIAWQIAHPYLDAQEIVQRQAAIRYIADNDALFAALQDIFELPERNSIMQKVNKYLGNASGLTRQTFAKNFPRPGFFNFATLGRAALIAVTAYFQWDLVEKLIGVVNDPTLSAAGSTLATWAVIAFSSTAYRGHLPLLEANRRAIQMKDVLGNPDAHLAMGPELLQKIDEICFDQASCGRQARLFGMSHPLNDYLAAFVRLMGLSPYLSFPLALYLPSQRNSVFSIVAAMTELETLYAYAKLYRARRGEMVFPEIVDSKTGVLEIEDGHHPSLWIQNKESVANSIALSEDAVKTVIVTGPNTGGKTTFEQMSLTHAVLAMCGLPLPAKRARVAPGYVITNFTTNKGKIAKGISTFEAQAMRVTEVAKIVLNPIRAYPVMIAMDEILKGTSGPEHKAYERATLAIIHETPGALLTVATHDRTLATITEELNLMGSQGVRVDNVRVSIEGHLVLPGVSTDYNALEVMARVGAPAELIERSRAYLLAEQQDLASDVCVEKLKENQ